MGSAWVEHVKKVYARGKSKGMSYKEAMQKAKASWAKAKGKAGKAAAAPKGKKVTEKVKDIEAVAAKKTKKRAPKKKARKSAKKDDQDSGDQVELDIPQSKPSAKARSSRASRKSSLNRRDVAPKGAPGMGAPYKQ